MDTTIPLGFCQCGCGQSSPLAKQSRSKEGYIKGQPVRFLPGHGRRKGTLEQRFWSFVDKSASPDACWPWIGMKYTTGYGCITHRDTRYSAHRLAWELAHGPIPPGMAVCHRCDNRPCCRAECAIPGCEHRKDSPGCQSHLFLGTPAENIADMIAKGRRATDCHPGKLTADQVIAIRARYAAGGIMQRDLAAEYGIIPGTVCGIVTRRTWRHI